MDHDDHVALIRDGIGGGMTWADLGSGGGAFTLAMADLLGPGATIYSVDRDQAALAKQSSALRDRFPNVTLHPIVADFTQPLDLPALDVARGRGRVGGDKAHSDGSQPLPRLDLRGAQPDRYASAATA